MKRSIKPYFIYFIYILAAVGLAVGYEQWHTQQPIPDFSNLPGYISAVELSHDSKMMAIKREIADGPANLAQEKKAAQAEGVPLHLSVLEQPLPPPGQNAATLYAQLNAMRHQHPLKLPEYADSLRIGYAYTPQELATVQKIIADHANQFHLLHQAARMPQYVLQKNWSLGDKVLFPELSHMREYARELVTESYLLARQGHYQQAIADQALGFKIARQTASEPTLINYLVGVAINAVTLKGMQNILYLAGPNLNVDDAVAQAISTSYTPPSLKHALAGEAERENENFNSLWLDPTQINEEIYFYQSPFPQSPPLTPQQLSFARDFVDAAEAHYLSVTLQLIPVANQQGAGRRAFFARLAASKSFLQTISGNINPVLALDHFFLDYQPLPIYADHLHVLSQVTIASADALTVKADTGAFPDALPSRFIDPFDGKPLGYRREGKNGFVVYSVGADGKFDGGKPGQYEKSWNEKFFRYPGPPLKPVPADLL